MEKNKYIPPKNRFLPLIMATMVFTGAYFYDLKKYVPSSLDMGGPKKKPNLKKRLQNFGFF